jgi:cysteine desulfurase
MKKIYLDHNATTPLHPEVREAMLPFMGELFGNPSSAHWAGREVAPFIENARAHAAALVGARPEGVTFTSGGTESDNWAILSALKDRPGSHIITTGVEHPAVFNTCQEMEAAGHALTIVDVDKYGQVSPEAIRSAIRENTSLITVMLANNETGTINPIREITSIAREHDILMHTDAVQAIGKIPLDVRELGVDILSASGHKFNGPKGIGFQYVRSGVVLKPLIVGGHQERGMRSGTENVQGIVGLGKACEVAMRDMPERERTIRELRDKLEKGFRESVPDTEVNGHPTERVYNTLNISFKYIEGEALLSMMEIEGIAVSTGSACSSGTTEPSRVLKAMKLDPLCSRGSIRFSLGLGTTEEDIEHCLRFIPPLALRFQEMSPFSSK